MNISEGRDPAVLAALAAAAGHDLLDLHSDPHHHRSVLTLVGEEAPRAVAARAVELIDLAEHQGAHPRFGAIDVVPFVALEGSRDAEAVVARDGFATWLAREHGVPCFLYGLPDGPERSLPEVRRRAFHDLTPDRGPTSPHPTAGATAVGARTVLVAYNVWLATPDLDLARRVATAVRGPHVRALAFAIGARVQVSMNLLDPASVGPADAYEAVDRLSGRVAAGAELVGLLPESVLAAVDAERWATLDLSADRTIEARLAIRAEALR
jgi:glutamate formiminotransferase